MSKTSWHPLFSDDKPPSTIIGNQRGSLQQEHNVINQYSPGPLSAAGRDEEPEHLDERPDKDVGDPSLSNYQWVHLKVEGELDPTAVHWTEEQHISGRRIFRFSRRLALPDVQLIVSENFIPENSSLDETGISCIRFQDQLELQGYWVTSNEIVNLAEFALPPEYFALPPEYSADKGRRKTFRNRAFRKIDANESVTLLKDDSPMNMLANLDPKPLSIRKDTKVYPWKDLVICLKNILDDFVIDPLDPYSTFKHQHDIEGRKSAAPSSRSRRARKTKPSTRKYGPETPERPRIQIGGYTDTPEEPVTHSQEQTPARQETLLEDPLRDLQQQNQPQWTAYAGSVAYFADQHPLVAQGPTSALDIAGSWERPPPPPPPPIYAPLPPQNYSTHNFHSSTSSHAGPVYPQLNAPIVFPGLYSMGYPETTFMFINPGYPEVGLYPDAPFYYVPSNGMHQVPQTGSEPGTNDSTNIPTVHDRYSA